MSEIKTNKISPRKGTTQTIGDSGDTISIPCGVTTTNAGTISTAGITGGTIDNQGTITGLQGVINWDTTAKTANFNASSQAGYFVNTTSGAITVTFPASPTAGDVIALKDYANTFDTNNLTIDPNGNKIQGVANNFIISVEGTAANFIYVDATRGWVLTDASKASDITESATFICATGGCISTCGDFKIHTFTGPGTFTVSSIGNCATPSQYRDKVEYLVVAGGGGAGKGSPSGGSAGGGGAGGFRSNYPTCSGLTITAQGYPITVGGGGAGASGTCSGTTGCKGSDSIFSSITSTGGGYGGGAPNNNGTSGGPGGSGGGGEIYGGSGGTGNSPPVSPPQGNNGGTASSVGEYGGGAGGGSSAVGGNGTPTAAGTGGAGTGIGINPSCTVGTPGPNGSLRYFSGGGGGGAIAPLGTPGSPGGVGGGGSSGTNPGVNPGTAGQSGTTNTGGGGGSTGVGGTVAGSGGSGIVIIRYKYQ